MDRLVPLLTAALLGAWTASCASKPSHFYTLESVAAATDTPAASYAVIVGPVTIPASVDRPEMVVQVAPNQVELLEFDRWASPLGEAIARTVAGDLSTLLGTPRVASGPVANFAAAYRVTLDVQRFDAKAGDGVDVDTVWVVKPTDGTTVRSGRTTTREAAGGPGYDALAGAYSRALARLSEDVATAIRAEAAHQR
ncbi:PqiC family protein [Candidatus Binatia bacterium]|jgi:uncharacterized lipoprotein YmbA|nr:PqiC family protein [Candidatus Binatia bacterium]